MNCPKGHKLPNTAEFGQCTPLYCGGDKDDTASIGKVKKAKARKVRKVPPTEGALTLPDNNEDEIAVRSARSRQDFVKMPQDLEGAAAEAWADAKMVNLTPLALAELEYQLVLGDNDERWRAAKQVLESTGRGKKEQSVNGASPILIINGAALIKPWSKEKPAIITEGEIVND